MVPDWGRGACRRWVEVTSLAGEASAATMAASPAMTTNVEPRPKAFGFIYASFQSSPPVASGSDRRPSPIRVTAGGAASHFRPTVDVDRVSELTAPQPAINIIRSRHDRSVIGRALTAPGHGGTRR